MKYIVIDLPTDPTARTRRLVFEGGQGGRIYQRPDGTCVLVRSAWPLLSPALVDLASVPADWAEVMS